MALDAKELLEREQMICADCVVTGEGRVIAYRMVAHRVQFDAAAVIDESDLTDIFKNFSRKFGVETYVGGESSAHGSAGFFYKKTGESLDWLVMSLEWGPFVDMELCENGVRFLNAAGLKWFVPEGNIEGMYIEE